MSYRDGRTGYVPPQKREQPPTTTEWVAAGLAIGAAVLLFATTVPGRALLHIPSDQTTILRSLGGAWMCASFVMVSLWQRDRNGRKTREHRRFLPFMLLAITMATFLAIGTIVFG